MDPLAIVAALAAEYGDDIVLAIIQAVRTAMEAGAKTDAEALRLARANLPDRIDTTVEDLERRARLAAKRLPLPAPLPAGLGWMDEPDVVDEAAQQRIASIAVHAAVLRGLISRGPLQVGERAAVEALLAAVERGV